MKKSVKKKVVAAAKRERSTRPFPSCSYDEAERFARAAYDIASGTAVRRLTLFDQLGKSSESSASRDMLTNSSKYGLTKGSYKAEIIELSVEAQSIFGERTSPKEKARLRVNLAVQSVPTFAALYERFSDLKLPARAALIDASREVGVPDEFIEEAVDTFVLNLKSVGLLQHLSGAERIVKLEHMLDTITAQATTRTTEPLSEISVSSDLAVDQSPAGFDAICFYITPIGEEGSDERRHSDLFLSQIVEPALEQFGLKVVRADKIGKPGIISRQIFDYILNSKLVVVDLSFHNPNVFYELAIRHMLKRPVVQLSRARDKVPFDLNQMRTILIDDSSMYEFVPKMELYKSELASQVRKALESEDDADNPIVTYYPGLAIKVA